MQGLSRVVVKELKLRDCNKEIVNTHNMVNEFKFLRNLCSEPCWPGIAVPKEAVRTQAALGIGSASFKSTGLLTSV